MARIPEREVERLKSEVSLARLVEAAGVVLVRHGADWLGLCPFHDDKAPSLVVSPKKNLWHCLGACQCGGSVIDWVMRLEGVSFRHAVELLREGIPPLAAEAASVPRVVKQSTVPKLPAPVVAEADDHVLLGQVIDYYHATLKQSPEALAYLQQRGLNHPELIAHFKLGFANRTLGLRLPEKNRKAGAEMRARLATLGVLRESGHEHFNGSLVIPVMDEQGQIMEVYGRKITDNLRAGTPLHLYLPGPHRGVWNVAALAASKEIILCESLIDALTFWGAGYRHVTTSYGIEGFTAEHLAAFKQHHIERVLIAYDRDDAGEHAASALAEKLLREGMDCYRVQFPKGMDANEYALKVAPATQSLGLALRKAVWLGKGRAPTREVAIDGGLSTVREPLTNPSSADEPALSLAAESLAIESILPASPCPPAPSPEADAQVSEHEVVLRFGQRQYRVRGLPKNLAYDTLKVNVRVSAGAAFHLDTVDLYSARQRASYCTQAAHELRVTEGVIKTDLGQVLLQLEALQDAQIKHTLAVAPPAPGMTDTERAAALELLRDPTLLSRVLADFKLAGVVGEETNKLVAYLACVSRHLDKPLAVMIQSSSAAGKSSLLDAVLAFMPPEARVQYSALTGQSLFYMGTTHLKHKILAISEEEGAHQASYALKLLQSEGEVTIASTGKDEASGDLVTKEYKVEGPVMLLMTTTAIDLDEELLNRCLVLSVNESREQTQAIHRAQRARRTLDGLVAKYTREAVLTLHHHAQRLLRPLAIINPYAEQLTFLDDKTRMRRDHEKYLTLIDSLALLHQHQREIKTLAHAGERIDYLEVTREDIETANRLAHEVLGKTLDELPPQTRKLLTVLEAQVRECCRREQMTQRHYRFSRPQVRAWCGWSDTQVRVHLARLTELEYVLVHRGGRGHSFVYELLYDGEGQRGEPFVLGLLDVERLKAHTTAGTIARSRGGEAAFAGSTRPHNGGCAAPARGLNTAHNSELWVATAEA